ncbi:uncharacterized protein LOC110720105 [Chenopodium quinoa]|uniref:uncharacterized protein LOC110720105 n=1 Tax=Chenopodium quinoa TaxID=63459 RepID=UPI000B78EE5C|nr:uncharacterized protein LOC110720105 [Chenopodium quinoa]
MVASWSDSDSSDSDDDDQANLCLMAEKDTSKEEHLQESLKKKDYRWILDSGCSRHMSGNSSLFSKVETNLCGTITLGDKKKCNIVGIGKIGGDAFNSIDDVYLVDGLKYNLLSISQL